MGTKKNSAKMVTNNEIKDAINSEDPVELAALVQKENETNKALNEELDAGALRLDELLAKIEPFPGHEDIEYGDESCEVGRLKTEYDELGMRTECLECLTGREVVNGQKHRRSDGSRTCGEFSENECPLADAINELKARMRRRR